MSSAICMFSRGEDAVTSTSEDVHPVARHRLTGERSLLPFLTLCHFHKGAHGPPCNLLIMICSPGWLCPHRVG